MTVAAIDEDPKVEGPPTVPPTSPEEMVQVMGAVSGPELDRIAAAPAPAPAAIPPAPAASPPPASPVEAAQRSAEERRALGQEEVEQARDKADEDTERAKQEADFRDAAAQRLKELQARQELHRQAADAHYADVRAKAEGEPFHTFMESRTGGQKAAIAIGLLLGGVSWNQNNVNSGAQMLAQLENEYDANQREKHARLWKAVDEAAAGNRELDGRELRELSQLQADQAARHDAIASRLNASAAASRGARDVTAAKKVALDEQDKANANWSNASHSLATANHMDEENKLSEARIKEQEALAKKNEAQAAKLGRRGGVGGAGRSALEQGQVTLEGEIADAKAAGKPMSDRDIDRRAVELKIPLVGKPGQISAKSIKEGAAKEATTETKKTAAELKISEADNARTVRWYDGTKLGLAPSGRNVKDIGKDIANTKKYVDLVNEVADSFEKNGHILNPYSQEAKDRRSQMAELQALGRNISGLQASDAGQKLEYQMLGNTGIGPTEALQILPSPQTLRELGRRANTFLMDKLRTTLDPIPGGKLAPATQGNLTLIRGKDGKIHKFDAAGKEVS
jgi:hypothetical protein